MLGTKFTKFNNETRGYVGYVKISSINNAYNGWVLCQSSNNFSSYLGLMNQTNTDGWLKIGVNWTDTNIGPDEHIYKISYNGSSWKIINTGTNASIVGYRDPNATYIINVDNQINNKKNHNKVSMMKYGSSETGYISIVEVSDKRIGPNKYIGAG